MRRADLSDLVAFIAVADHLNFRAAAAQLNVTPPALSHTVRQLEERLGVRLLNRTTRSVSLTDAGRQLVEELRPAMEKISGVLDKVHSERDDPGGRLAICAPMIAVQIVLAPLWRRFLATYPNVHLEIGTIDLPPETVAKGFDAGITFRELVELDMTIVRVTGPAKVAVVGAPSYFAENPPPKMPEDLGAHNCIQLRLPTTRTLMEWSFNDSGETRPLVGKMLAVPITGNMTVDSPDLAVRAAVDGLGLAYTLDAHCELFLRSGQLVRVLEDWSPFLEGLFLYYPGHRQIPAALRALIDMIQEARHTAPAVKAHDNPFAQ